MIEKESIPDLIPADGMTLDEAYYNYVRSSRPHDDSGSGPDTDKDPAPSLTFADIIAHANKQADRVLAKGDGERPKATELAQWFESGDCPPEALSECCIRLTELLGEKVQPPLRFFGAIINCEPFFVSVGDLHDKFLKAVDDGKNPLWPLAPLVTAWQNRPRPVQPNTRTTKRVTPALLAMSNSPARQNGNMLFSPPAHATEGPDGDQMVMPGFGRPDAASPALPLALYDLGAGPATSPGRGAPLALRMFVESVLSVPMEERERGQPVAMSVSLRDFLAWLYPSRIPSPAEYWPRLMAAIEALDSREARIPLYDPQTNRSELRRVVSVSGIPRGPGALDESVRIIVDLPPGSGKGPQVSDRLRWWGVRSAPAYRLLINLAYQWYNPGVTIVPVGKGKARHWVQAMDPDRYPKISDSDLISLAFPTTRRDRGRRFSEVLAVARQLEKAGELRIVEGKFLPPTISTNRR